MAGILEKAFRAESNKVRSHLLSKSPQVDCIARETGLRIKSRGFNVIGRYHRLSLDSNESINLLGEYLKKNSQIELISEMVGLGWAEYVLWLPVDIDPDGLNAIPHERFFPYEIDIDIEPPQGFPLEFEQAIAKDPHSIRVYAIACEIYPSQQSPEFTQYKIDEYPAAGFSFDTSQPSEVVNYVVAKNCFRDGHFTFESEVPYSFDRGRPMFWGKKEFGCSEYFKLTDVMFSDYFCPVQLPQPRIKKFFKVTQWLEKDGLPVENTRMIKRQIEIAGYPLGETREGSNWQEGAVQVTLVEEAQE